MMLPISDGAAPAANKAKAKAKAKAASKPKAAATKSKKALKDPSRPKKPPSGFVEICLTAFHSLRPLLYSASRTMYGGPGRVLTRVQPSGISVSPDPGLGTIRFEPGT